MKIPQHGHDRDDVLAKMERYRDGDADPAAARLFSLVYATRPDIVDLAKTAYTSFFSENALNPMTFPSLARFESEVVGMALSLLNAPAGASGTVTSGGSESLLLAVKTARDWARAERPEVTEPEILLPVTAHPALLKAAHTLGIKPVLVPMTDDFVADVAAARALATDRTILVVGSSPQYPHGVVDPIEALAKLAEERRALCHVDACVGGFMLPWVERLGRKIPAWDFRVPGVTSISADLHKYAYAAKGASVVLYRSQALRRHQIFVHADWPGGLFASPGVLGTRPGGAVAAAWAVMTYLGEEGYLELAKRALDATDRFAEGVRAIPGLTVLGAPAMTILAIGQGETPAGKKPIDLFVLGDLMQERGWRLDRQQLPSSLHLTVSPAHDQLAGAFLDDLAACAREAASRDGAPEGAAAMYGMLATLPDRAMVREALLDVMDNLAAAPPPDGP